MNRAEQAIQSLYEDPHLREDLTDAEAKALMTWAEGEIRRLDAAHPDDGVGTASFDQAVDALMNATEDMNRVGGRRAFAPVAAQAAQLDSLAASAAAAGLNADRAALGSVAETTHPANPAEMSAQAASALVGAGLGRADEAANIALIEQMTNTLTPAALPGALPSVFTSPASSAQQAEIETRESAKTQAANNVPVPSTPASSQTALEADLGLPAGSVSRTGGVGLTARRTGEGETVNPEQSASDTRRRDMREMGGEERTARQIERDNTPDETDEGARVNPAGFIGQALGSIFRNNAEADETAREQRNRPTDDRPVAENDTDL